MFLCLSSASRGGYSKDVVDTLAAPEGGERQFRYDEKWVDPHIKNLIKQDKLPANAKCLLCFVDLRGKPEEPFILPLREAVLTRVIPVGTTYTLVFQLGAFRRPSDLQGFSDFARQKFPSLHHIKHDGGAIKPSGYLWTDAKDQLDSQLLPLTSDGNWTLAWEGIVRDYLTVMKAPESHSKRFLDRPALSAEENTFKDQSPFYVFYGLRTAPNGDRALPIADGGRAVFKLKPGTNYELSFYQFHPTESFPNVSLTLNSNSSHIDFIGGKEHKFDTRYDVKRFMFSTTSLLSGASGNIRVTRSFHHAETEDVVEDMYINYDVKSSWAKIGIYVFGITLAFVLPQWLALYTASTAASPLAYLVMVVGGVALGLLTTFKDFIKLS